MAVFRLLHGGKWFVPSPIFTLLLLDKSHYLSRLRLEVKIRSSKLVVSIISLGFLLHLREIAILTRTFISVQKIDGGGMGEHGARLKGKKANFGGFTVLRHPMIVPLFMAENFSDSSKYLLASKVAFITTDP